MRSAWFSGLCAVVLAAVSLAASGPAVFALGISDGDYPIVDATKIAKPSDAVMAKIVRYPYDTGARISSVVIAPNYIMTAGHWSLYEDYRVYVEGDSATYRIAAIRKGNLVVDIAVIRIEKCTGQAPDLCSETEDANLAQWVGLYGESDEVNKEITVGSYGHQQTPTGLYGRLHWARDLEPVLLLANRPYMKYQLTGIFGGDSGSPCFIRNGWDWQVAELIVGIMQSIVSGNVAWIEGKIDEMNEARPPAEQEAAPHPAARDLTDTSWSSPVSDAWDDPGNWDPVVPDSNAIVVADRVADPPDLYSPVISSGTDAAAKELGIGYRETGELTQTGGTFTVTEGVYLGIRPGSGGSLTLSGGTLSADTLRVGVHGSGTLQITDSSAVVNVANLSFGPGGTFGAVAGTTINMAALGTHYDHRFTINEGASGTNLAGLGNTHLKAEFTDGEQWDPDVYFQIEAAGAPLNEDDPESSFSDSNFLIDTLSVGVDPTTLGRGTRQTRVVVQIADASNNEPGFECEAVYVNNLIIRPGVQFVFPSSISCSGGHLYYRNGGAVKELIVGDANLDGKTDALDYAVVSQPKASGASWADGDFDGDRDVDGDDLQAWRNNQTVIYVNDHLTTGANTGDTWDGALHGFVGGESSITRAVLSTLGVTYGSGRSRPVEIWVAAGTYVPTDSGDRTKSFPLARRVTLLGGFNGTETYREERDVVNNQTILSGDLNGDDANGGSHSENSLHVVRGDDSQYSGQGRGLDASAVLDEFVITGGNADGDGSYQGAIDRHGGGIQVGYGPAGGVAGPMIRNCIIRGNHAAFGGGGVGIYGDSDRFNNLYADPTLINCILVDNTAGERGGGTYNCGGEPVLVNCTVSNNKTTGAYGLGGGIYTVCNDIDQAPSDLRAENCILWGNTDANGTGTSSQVYVDTCSGSTVHVSYSCIRDNVPGDGVVPFDTDPNDPKHNIDLDPLLGVDLRPRALSPQSPCVNAGNNTPAGVALPETDLAENPRIYDEDWDGRVDAEDVVDMGAYERIKPVIISAVSRRTHGAAGHFDVPSGSWEGRVATSSKQGPSTIVTQFNLGIRRVTNTNADVSVSSGRIGSIKITTTDVTNDTLVVTLTGVSNKKTFTIGYPGIAAACDKNARATAKNCWVVLAGECSGPSGSPPRITVNTDDSLFVRTHIGQALTWTNFRADVDADGHIDTTDLLTVRANNSSTALVPTCP